MHDHTETEHKNNHVHSKCQGIRQIENEKYSVIYQIDYQRIYGIINRFSKTDKNVVYYGALWHIFMDSYWLPDFIGMQQGIK